MKPFFLLLLAVLALGCSRAPSQAPALSFGAGRPAVTPKGVVQLAGRRYEVELALNPEEQERGLMGRAELPEGTGMLFVFPSEQPLSFWMKETKVPLDILYFSADRRLLTLHRRAQPCRNDPCPVYPSLYAAQYALELPAGDADKLGVLPGALLEIKPR